MSHSDLVKNWIQDLRGSNQNTYKFALQRAILLNSTKQEISISQLASTFVKLYWNNVISFKLRETNNINQLPQFHRSIIQVALEYKIDSVNYHHAKKSHTNLESLVIKNINKPIDDVLANPISRLQHDYKTKTANGDSRGSGWLYEWDLNDGIRIKDKYFDSLNELKFALNNLTIYSWAHFLEKYNHTPALLQKLEDLKGTRTIPAKIRSFIIQHSSKRCFYCESDVYENYDIDHFIPFAFIYDSPAWDLVLSCISCNRGVGGKFDQLASKEFLKKLENQNNILAQHSPEVFKSFINHQGVNDFNERLIKEYQACMNAGFNIWKN